MGAAHHQHAKTALADAAADGQGQLVVEELFVEGQLPAVIAAGDLQLVVQGSSVHTDAHGGDLQSAAQHIIPEEDVAVELPVIIVGGAAVVGLAGAELAADLHDAGGAVLLDEGLLTLGASGQVGVHILQCLGGDEGHFPAQVGVKLGIADLQPVVGVADGTDDGTDDELQVLGIAVVTGDDLLPVPLVDVDGVDIIQIFVSADGVHIGVQAAAHAEIVALQGHALPLRQGMDDLGVGTHGGNVKGNGALVAVQVIVQAGSLGDEKGCGNTLQVQRIGKLLLEGVLDVGNGPLGIVLVQDGLVALGDVAGIHVINSLSVNNRLEILYHFLPRKSIVFLQKTFRYIPAHSVYNHKNTSFTASPKVLGVTILSN